MGGAVHAGARKTERTTQGVSVRRADREQWRHTSH